MKPTKVQHNHEGRWTKLEFSEDLGGKIKQHKIEPAENKGKPYWEHKPPVYKYSAEIINYNEGVGWRDEGLHDTYHQAHAHLERRADWHTQHKPEIMAAEEKRKAQQEVEAKERQVQHETKKKQTADQFAQNKGRVLPKKTAISQSAKDLHNEFGGSKKDLAHMDAAVFHHQAANHLERLGLNKQAKQHRKMFDAHFSAFAKGKTSAHPEMEGTNITKKWHFDEAGVDHPAMEPGMSHWHDSAVNAKLHKSLESGMSYNDLRKSEEG